MSTGISPGRGFARRVTLDDLGSFAPLLRPRADRSGRSGPRGGDGAGSGDSQEPDPPDPLLAAAEELFQGESLRVRVPFTRPARSTGRPGGGESEQPESAPVEATPSPPTHAAKGPLLWSKKMSMTDAQEPEKPTTHPKYGMTLVQAGHTIDQTSYFRHTVFGSFPWSTARQQPLVEETRVRFNITALGQELGEHALKISDKQSGEAGENNYTTTLHWKGITQTIRALHLTGRTFKLYGPAPGTAEPYFIEIV